MLALLPLAVRSSPLLMTMRVPEPTWLTHLIAPFADGQSAAVAGGYVIGRNGISFQWKASDSFAVEAQTEDLILDYRLMSPTFLAASPARAIKTEGTNMAVRRDVLVGTSAALTQRFGSTLMRPI